MSWRRRLGGSGCGRWRGWSRRAGLVPAAPPGLRSGTRGTALVVQGNRSGGAVDSFPRGQPLNPDAAPRPPEPPGEAEPDSVILDQVPGLQLVPVDPAGVRAPQP